MRRQAKPRWILYLLYGITVVMLLTTVTLSRYLTTISGTGAAQVANVALGGTLPINVTDMHPGESRAIAFTVKNADNGKISEVAQSYAISVSSTGNLPLSFTLGSSESTDHALTQANGSSTWTGGLLPHTTETTHAYTLTVSWPGGQNNPKYAKEVDAVTLRVDAQQAN